MTQPPKDNGAEELYKEFTARRARSNRETAAERASRRARSMARSPSARGPDNLRER